MRSTRSSRGRSSDFTHSEVGSIALQHGSVAEQPPPGFQRQFEFIEGLNSKAERKKTRSWVTTQHYRRKRFEECGAEDTADAEKKKKAKRRPRSTPPSRSSKSDENQPPRTKPEGHAKAAHMITGTNQALPLQRLGSGRADPFSSYPIPATPDVHELVDHFYFVIPSLVHKYWQRAARRPRACWDLFNLYRMHEIPFLGMLHHAAHHLASMRGQQESLQVIEFKQRSLVAVNRRLQILQEPCDDWTIIGVGLLANAERVWGDREIARLHWGALKRLLLKRGGFPSLRHNTAMHTKLVWSFIALSGPTPDGNPAYEDSCTELAGAMPGSPAKDSDSAFRSSCEEFVRFFDTRRRQALANLPSTPAQQREFRSRRFQKTIFQDGSELSRALESKDMGYLSAEKRRSVENCRMACLIHLNLIMTDYGDFSQPTEDYLRSLQRILDQDDDDSSLSAEHLLWTLLAAFPPEENYKRIWQMCRLVDVAKCARVHTWVAIENALRTFLRAPESVAELEAVTSGWNREDLLAEVRRHEGTDGTETLSCRRHGADASCSEDCKICPLRPATF
ncbi:hypothetical protein G647_04246 [Cladophialophora carrionii CBS 160.54]|uniref:Uncharacterized protein n=1 Tax=Cladophialophora carrionii CBS 160.54 TaxID=1279043 RepID=V9DDZ2_9EURO|nr:uncharacterized protein G647_04246 [Cladophialophora carrionii CBS 160.54]ETI24876.1 hypothetical protein G647_04246 [Cladophialophora carrionii CBS 160.54]